MRAMVARGEKVCSETLAPISGDRGDGGTGGSGPRPLELRVGRDLMTFRSQQYECFVTISLYFATTRCWRTGSVASPGIERAIHSSAH